jgi:uncharacterized SAM-binding protein YcdF (DUF218 family)
MSLSPGTRSFPRAKRWLLLTAFGLVLGVPSVLSVGHLVDEVDPIAHADAIYVLGGTRVDRALEAYDLYRGGYAPRIVMSAGSREDGEFVLEREGIHVPTEAEIMRTVLVTRLGVPASAISILPDDVDNTAQEATVIQPRARAESWRHLIVVTGCATTRRAGFAFRRVLRDEVAVTVWCSRHDTFDPGRWWATRASVRATVAEVPKLLAYWLGLKG